MDNWLAHVLLLAVLLISILSAANRCEAGTLFLELGAYHRLDMSDPLITTNNQMGSDTPGTIDIGVEWRRCGWFFGADRCSLLHHHQSYVDRGDPFNAGPEAQLDMFGFRARWDLWAF